jgi:hypothetical protein
VSPRFFTQGPQRQGHFNVIGDTVTLVDKSGKALASGDQKYSQNPTAADNGKQVAAQLLDNTIMRSGEARAASTTN